MKPKEDRAIFKVSDRGPTIRELALRKWDPVKLALVEREIESSVREYLTGAGPEDDDASLHCGGCGDKLPDRMTTVGNVGRVLGYWMYRIKECRK